TPARFAAHTTHVESVLEVPVGAQVLARSARDPHQILRYGPRAFSTQLHPEFSVAVMRAYLRLRAASLRAESLDVRAMLNEVRATPHARRLLRRFAHGMTRTNAESMEPAARPRKPNHHPEPAPATARNGSPMQYTWYAECRRSC